VIPEEYCGAAVVGVLANAFSDDSIKTVILSKKLKYIEKDAFSSINLSFNEHDGAKYLGTLDNPYFALISSNQNVRESVEINNECVIISDFALNIHNLRSVTGGDKVSFVGNSAFKNAMELVDIDIFDTVCEIGESAFFACSRLASISFGNGLSQIGKNAFAHCQGLSYLKLSGTLSIIPENAFLYAVSLDTVLIGTSIKEIALNAFYGMGDDAKIYYLGSESEWNEIELNSNFEANADMIFYGSGK
jgi:hypothetical protein